MNRPNRRIEPSFNSTVSPNETYRSSTESFSNNINDQYLDDTYGAMPPSKAEVLLKASETALCKAFHFSKKHLFYYYQQYPKPFMIAGASLCAGVLLISLLSGEELSGEEKEALAESTQNTTTVIEHEALARFNLITLPDNFTLSTDNYDALTISWPTTAATDKKVWDISTAVGKQGCQNITFNNKESFRSLSVTIRNGDYMASFSPLDTNEIVSNIAKKSSFELCDFSFSLKGTQAVLSKNPRYLSIIN